MNTREFKVSEQTATILELQATFCKLMDDYYDALCEMWGEDVAEERAARIHEHKEALWDEFTRLLGEGVRQNFAAVNNLFSVI